MKHTHFTTAALAAAVAVAGCQKEAEPQGAPPARPAPTVASRAPGAGWETQPAQPAVSVSAPQTQGSVGVPVQPAPVAPAVAESTMEVALYRRTPGGDAERVGTDFVFRSGDAVRFGVKASRDGFLYLLMKGSSGRSAVIYPDKRIARGQHSIKAGQEVLVPGSLWFEFDRKPGTEVVYAMFTPTPDALTAGLDALGAAPAAAPAPALEAQVLAQLQSKSRGLPISGQLQSGPAPGAPGPVSPAVAPAVSVAPGAPAVAATTGSLVAVVTLRHE